MTLRWGHAMPDDVTAARTRSRDSLSAVSGSPTRTKPGTDAARWACTSTT
ncbi:Uncharacterised protein [Mycobacteroides abscessus]|nr:Uncharacterised protein [Mycobacteroides abscessus]